MKRWMHDYEAILEKLPFEIDELDAASTDWRSETSDDTITGSAAPDMDRSSLAADYGSMTPDDETERSSTAPQNGLAVRIANCDVYTPGLNPAEEHSSFGKAPPTLSDTSTSKKSNGVSFSYDSVTALNLLSEEMKNPQRVIDVLDRSRGARNSITPSSDDLKLVARPESPTESIASPAGQAEVPPPTEQLQWISTREILANPQRIWSQRDGSVPSILQKLFEHIESSTSAQYVPYVDPVKLTTVVISDMLRKFWALRSEKMTAWFFEAIPPITSGLDAEQYVRTVGRGQEVIKAIQEIFRIKIRRPPMSNVSQATKPHGELSHLLLVELVIPSVMLAVQRSEFSRFENTPTAHSLTVM